MQTFLATLVVSDRNKINQSIPTADHGFLKENPWADRTKKNYQGRGKLVFSFNANFLAPARTLSEKSHV